MPKATNTDLYGLATSGIRKFTALANQTPGCIKLTLGEPEFATPSVVSEAASQALMAGQTHYGPNNGTLELREALSAYMSDQGLSYSADEIIVTIGATEALASTLQALINPGDEVIIPQPAFGLYETLVIAAHGKVVPLATADNNFQISASALGEVVGERTKAIVLTSPNNPTGCVYTQASLDTVANLAQEHGFYVICDDVYNRLAYESAPRFALEHPELREQTIVVDSFSKPWAMTGWRLGWLATSPDVKTQIEKMHQYNVSCSPTFLQAGAARALSCDISEMYSTYQKRRDYVFQELSAMGLRCIKPGGAFYAFPSIEGYGLTSEEFCTRAITEARVALVPGTCFGTEGFVRLSYCVSDANLHEGVRRLGAFIAQIQ